MASNLCHGYDPGMTVHGVQRETGLDGEPDRAWVDDGGPSGGRYLAEAQYKQGGYHPPWDQLPWKPRPDAARGAEDF